VPLPSECTDAGLTTFAENVQLTAAAPRFVAAEDRPGATGPFLVIGTDADDTITVPARATASSAPAARTPSTAPVATTC